MNEDDKNIQDHIDEAYDRMRDDKAMAEYEAEQERAEAAAVIAQEEGEVLEE